MTQPVLNYESNEKPVKRPKWVFIVVGLYVLLLLGFLFIPAYFSYDSNSSPDETAFILIAGAVSLIVLGGLSLVLVPVRVHSRRPIRRGHIIWPIIGSGAMFGLLVFGGGIAVIEWINPSNANGGDTLIWFIIALAGVVWIAWTLLFMMMTWSSDPNSFSIKLHKKVLAGSVLELLVAVPAHVVVRQRSECCAGYMTGAGICIGVAVMLVSFGPGVLLLYWRRVQKISNK